MEILDHQQRAMRITPGRVLLGLVVLASFGIWGYAYSGAADRPPPDLLEDPAIAAAAEPRCAAAREQLLTLEPAYLASDHLDRAATVEDANAVLGTMVADLRDLRAAGERDQQILDDWLSDWETYLADRADYAHRLRDDPTARFYQSDVAANEMLDRRLTRMADTNAMPSCGNPGDVG